jgi:hypothetical protein
MPKLTPAETERLLRAEGLVRIGTINADGSPHIAPVAFLYRDQQILLTARERVTWLANLRRDPRVCAVIDQVRYPLAKLTINGFATVVYEPGLDDQWRHLRLPLATESTAGPTTVDEEWLGEWSYDAAYRLITEDEPRALVSIALGGARVTSWRLPIEGEFVDESWARRYYRHEPRRFRVVKSGPRMDDVRVAVVEDP